MSRHCRCRSRCPHLVRGGDPLILLPPRLLPLLDVMAVLVDAADAFDSESLQFDPACGVHGLQPMSNAECICIGHRYSAAEFIQALQLDARSALERVAPAGRPNASRSHDPRMLAPTG